MVLRDPIKLAKASILFLLGIRVRWFNHNLGKVFTNLDLLNPSRPKWHLENVINWPKLIEEH